MVKANLIIAFYIILTSCSSITMVSNNDPSYDVTIYRDKWGVPHIYGETDRDVAFGLAYANAEADFKNVQDALLAARGEMARYYGKEYATVDYMVGLLEIWDYIDTYYYTDLSKETIDLCESYADGVNQYIEDNPGVAHPGVYPITGKDLVAGFMQKTPTFFDVHLSLSSMFSKKPHEIKQKFDFIDTREFIENRSKGSNVYAVSKEKSSDGKVRLAVNAHQPWEGQYAWFEAHVHSNEGWNMVGGLFPGSPVVLVGHNENLGWGHTVNSPDIVDIYQLEMHPNKENYYKIDGEWKELRSKEIPINVKIWGPFSWTFKESAFWSDHGPVIKGEHATYAIRYSGYGDVRIVEQWYKMNKASNYEQWKSAMEMQALPMFNAGYADKDGNIYYVYNAKLPKRTEGYNWQKVLPGDDSSLIWNEYLDFSDLPQVMNPEAGFIQNCNSSPFHTTLGKENPIDEKYHENLGIERHLNNRTIRSLELFGADDSISDEEFIKYKYDTQYSKESNMVKYIDRLKKISSEIDSDYMDEALDIMSDWDLSVSLDSHEATLPILTFGLFLEIEPKEITDEQIISSFTEATSYLFEHYGRIDVMWGRINRLVRGETSLGLSGAPDVPHAIYGLPTDKGYLRGYAGDAYLMIIDWDEEGNVNSRSIHQFGSYQNHDSPHFSDQSQMFVQKELKQIWFDLKSIQQNLEKKYRPIKDFVDEKIKDISN